MEHLEGISPISVQQWGFSKGKSTTGALLTSIDEWHHALQMGEDSFAVGRMLSFSGSE